MFHQKKRCLVPISIRASVGTGKLGRAPVSVTCSVPTRHCREALFLWRVNKLDFFVWVVAWAVVTFAGVEIGLATAVGLSLIIVLWKVRHCSRLLLWSLCLNTASWSSSQRCAAACRTVQAARRTQQHLSIASLWLLIRRSPLHCPDTSTRNARSKHDGDMPPVCAYPGAGSLHRARRGGGGGGQPGTNSLRNIQQVPHDGSYN